MICNHLVLLLLFTSQAWYVSASGYQDDSICLGGALICQNQGRCINGTTCLCYPGFTEVDCSRDITCESISRLLKNTLIIETQGNSYGAMVTYTCKYGYQFVIAGDRNLDPTSAIRKTVRCNLDGKWGPNFADCKPLCPVIPTWSGYKIVVDDDDDSGGAEWQPRLDGTKLRYSCSGVFDQGIATALGRTESAVRYKFADLDTNPKIAYCHDGQWIPPLVPCIDLLYDSMDSSADLSLSASVYTAFALLTSLQLSSL